MKKAGGIVAIIAGVFGVIAAGLTLLVGGLGAAFNAEGSGTVVGLGWGGVVFSFAVIVLGSIAVGAKNRTPGILLILTSIVGVFLGGTLVAVFMTLALIGGILATTGVKSASGREELASDTPQS